MRYFLSTLALFLLIVGFQNCDQELGQLGETPRAQERAEPFAVDVLLDTIAYSSCNGKLTPNNFFTFKFAAVGQDTGIRLSNAFFDSMGTQERDQAAKLDALENNDSLQNLQAQISVRDIQNPMSVEAYGNSAILYSAPSFFNPASDIRRLSFLNRNQLSRFFGNEIGSLQLLPQNLFEVSETSTQGDGPMSIRFNQGQIVLTLDYNDPAGDVRGARDPLDYGDSSQRGIYGNVYKLNFLNGSSLNPNDKTAHKKIRDIEEYEGLRSPEATSVVEMNQRASYSCRHYKIVRFGDDPQVCGDFDTVTTSEQHMFAILGTDWEWDGNDCIRPKMNTGCYDYDLPIQIDEIVYRTDPTSLRTCLIKDDLIPVGGISNFCHQYLSICKR